MSTDSDQAHRRAQALFKKEQQGREGQQEYEAKLGVMREKTARLRALRLARDAANKKTPPINITKVRRKHARSRFSTSVL